MKNKILHALTCTSVGMLLFTIVLHIIGFFAYWDSRWHLWAYIPLLALLLSCLVWKCAVRVPRGTFRAYCRTAFLLFTILLLIYMFCMFCINIITAKDGGGYVDSEGNAYLDPYYEFEITGDEYRTLRRAAYQMTTEPLVSIAALPALFYTTRLRAELDLPAHTEKPKHRKKKKK